MVRINCLIYSFYLFKEENNVSTKQMKTNEEAVKTAQ